MMTIYQPLIFAFSFKQLYISFKSSHPLQLSKSFAKIIGEMTSSPLWANGTIVLHRIVNNLFGFSYYNLSVIISSSKVSPLLSLPQDQKWNGDNHGLEIPQSTNGHQCSQIPYYGTVVKNSLIQRRKLNVIFWEKTRLMNFVYTDALLLRVSIECHASL